MRGRCKSIHIQKHLEVIDLINISVVIQKAGWEPLNNKLTMNHKEDFDYWKISRYKEQDLGTAPWRNPDQKYFALYSQQIVVELG